jgi:hypothetical protein
MNRTWRSIASTPPTQSAVELRFDDGTSDLALWTGSTWLPAFKEKHPKQWRDLPIPFPLLDEYRTPATFAERCEQPMASRD